MNKNFTLLKQKLTLELFGKAISCLLICCWSSLLIAQPSGKYGPQKTNYEVPGGAYFVSPTGTGKAPCTEGKPCSLATALKEAPRGSTLVLKDGIYRTSKYSTTIKRQIIIQPYPGANVILKGSEVAKDWQESGNTWRVRWNDLYGKPNNDDGRAVGIENPMADHRDMVFIDGVYQKQVESIAMLGPGKFYVDYNDKMVYLGSNPSGKEVEISAEWWGLNTYGLSETGVIIRGLQFMHYADAGIFIGSPAAIVENSESTWNGAAGIRVQLASDVVLKNNLFAYNACQGGGLSYADRIKLIGNSFSNNNIEKLNRNSWSASGVKILWAKEVEVYNNLFENNDANGLWLDEKCNGSILANNYLKNNTRNGIHCEISDDVIIAGNVVLESGRSNKYIGVGISVANASDVRVYNNTLHNNEVALDVIESTRGDEKDPNDPYITRNTVIKNNILSEAFVDDYPSALYHMKKKKCSDEAIKEQDNNAYYRSNPGSPSLAVRWKINDNSCNDEQRLETIKEFREKLGYEQNGFGIQGGSNPFFINAEKEDFRLTSTSLAIKSGAPLPEDVAKAIGWKSGVVVDIGAYQTNISEAPAPNTGSLPWKETFTTSNGATDDNGYSDGSAWLIDRGNMSTNGALKVENQKLMARGTVGEGVWYSEQIRIKDHQVNLSLNLYSQGELENRIVPDYVKVYTIIDGKEELLTEVLGGIPKGEMKIETSNIIGESLQIAIKFKNSDYAEFYYVDNIEVYSTGSTIPEAEITGLSLVEKQTSTSTYQNKAGEVDVSLLSPEELDLLAEAEGDVGSVVFEYEGNSQYQVDNDAPYYLFGNNTQGSFKLGNNSVFVKVYSKANGEGELLSEKDYTFTLKQVKSDEAIVRWHEDFSLSNGVRNDEGITAWHFEESTVSDSKELYEVKDGMLWLSETSKKSDNGYVTWKSETINISGQSAKLSLLLKHQGKMENDLATGDYVKVSYKVDDQPVRELMHHFGGFTNEDEWYEFEESDIRGDELQIFISARTTTDTESYFVDNIKVTEDKVERFAQHIPWNEDFNVKEEVLQQQDETAWFFSSSKENQNDRFGLKDEALYISANARPIKWASYPIHIADVESVKISIDIKEKGGLESKAKDHDFLYIYYRVNKEDWQPILLQNGNLAIDDHWFNIEEKGIKGDTLEIMIEGKTSSWTETYYVDNISVESETDEVVLQSIPWVENFLGADKLLKQDDETAWFFENTDTEAIYGVHNEHIQISKATYSTKWTSSKIDISTAENIKISFDIKETGELEPSGETKDYLNFYYKVDDGELNPVLLQNGNLIKDDYWYHFEKEGIKGTTLQLVVEGQTSARSEVYYIDNIEVLEVDQSNESPEISVLTIFAAGKSGYETMELKVDGQVVKTWTGVGGNVYDPIFEEYVYEHVGNLEPKQIQITYVNENGPQPYTGLRVDKININGVEYETEASTTYGSGILVDGVCKEGFLETESLDCGGYFKYMASSQNDYFLDINAFPNPAKSIQMLEFTTNIKSVDVRIIDMQGVERIKYPQTNTGNTLQLDLSSLESGLYVIHVIGEGEFAEMRIYKE
ncbi:right-handed parallel beta-helix repeat-containing protein [Porifericola rhodea]|uniref:right-handed parallel beta-helix repeat-containing protein n=1 Tax=Porifericola rhodea TaxID=930972 RepID=UPI002665A6F6|nr:right-handed parallel beta-helix repeat-containing protein [Porifericola rhodea]WKN32535.1 right-handed parallel beta-helix repeat-containing protein [Porifericola rhodea]